jgi:hypothetical protein
MIEKFLIRFCAPEVRTMITRLRERPDDFTYGSRWRDLAKAKEGFTWVERKVMAKEWAKFQKNEKRREVLSLITKEVIDPTPLYADMLDSARYAQALAASKSFAQNIALQYNDPRGLYGKHK